MNHKNAFLALMLMLFSQTCLCGKVYEIGKMDSKLKEKILDSAIKKEILGANGKKYIVYLYTDNEERTEESNVFSCQGGEPRDYTDRTGKYFIYLYDVDSKKFESKKTKLFRGNDIYSLDSEGYEIIIFNDTRKKKVSDVLLISKFGGCRGNFFEAYGLSSDGTSIVNYKFRENKELYHTFFGYISDSVSNNSLVAYKAFDYEAQKMQKTSLHLSDKHGEIEVELIDE